MSNHFGTKVVFFIVFLLQNNNLNLKSRLRINAVGKCNAHYNNIIRHLKIKQITYFSQIHLVTCIFPIFPRARSSSDSVQLNSSRLPFGRSGEQSQKNYTAVILNTPSIKTPVFFAYKFNWTKNRAIFAGFSFLRQLSIDPSPVRGRWASGQQD